MIPESHHQRGRGEEVQTERGQGKKEIEREESSCMCVWVSGVPPQGSTLMSPPARLSRPPSEALGGESRKHRDYSFHPTSVALEEPASPDALSPHHLEEPQEIAMITT